MLEINGTIIAVIANFIILAWILEHFFYRPVRDGLLERKKGIEKNLSDAAKKLDEASSMKARYEKDLSEAQEKAQEIVRNASQEIDKMKEKAAADLKQQAAGMIEQARGQAEALKSDALQSAGAEITDMVILAAGKLMKSRMSPESDRALIDAFTKEIKRSELN